jgi:hypothetical protein
MNEKRRLILHFILDCLFIVLLGLAMITNVRFIFILWGLYAVYLRKFLQKKYKAKTKELELTTPETIAWFLIGFSALWIGFFAVYKGLFSNPVVIVPLGIIGLAFRLLAFAKDWATLKTPAPASS